MGTNISYIYLKCVLFQEWLQIVRLIPEVDLILPKSVHNHDVEEDKAEVFELKAKCWKRAGSSKDNLREVFNDVTHQITFKECESLIYRARCNSLPRIPKSVIEFCAKLPTTNFAGNLISTIKLDEWIYFSLKTYSK